MIEGKILVVEDEATLRDILKYNLESEGYTVMVADNGLAGLKSTESDSPDLIILDVMLPELDGFEVCRRLRQDSTVPILMLTAKEEEIDKVLGRIRISRQGDFLAALPEFGFGVKLDGDRGRLAGQDRLARPLRNGTTAAPPGIDHDERLVAGIGEGEDL